MRRVIPEPYQNPVRVHDRVQSVGNGQDGTLRELVMYSLLNYSISPVREESLMNNGTEANMQNFFIT